MLLFAKTRADGVPTALFVGIVLFFSITGCCLAQRPKILALHGGGGSPEGFRNSPGMVDLEDELSEFDFVYAQGGFPMDGGSGYLWNPDPPSKAEPTTSPNVSDDSLSNLDLLVQREGPFFGILGYSQGAAFVPVYLAHRQATDPQSQFQTALMFCGYPTETHEGLSDLVRRQSPFGGIPALVWIGAQDFVIPPSLSRGLVPMFEAPVAITSPNGDHAVPGRSDGTFGEVVAFVRGGDEPTTVEILPPDETEESSPSPSSSSTSSRRAVTTGLAAALAILSHLAAAVF